MACSSVGLIISHHKCQGINSQSSLDFVRFFLKLLGEDNVHFYNTWYSVSWYHLYRAVFTWLSKVIEELVWFWFYYALWLASVFTLVLVLRQSSENRSNRCMLSFHLLILPHHFQSQHFPGMRVDLLISLCVSYLGVQPTISHAPSSAKSEATPQHQMTHFLNSLGRKN